MQELLRVRMKQAEVIRIKGNGENQAHRHLLVSDIKNSHQRFLDVRQAQLRQRLALVPLTGHHLGLRRIKIRAPFFPQFPFRDHLLRPEAQINLLAFMKIDDAAARLEALGNATRLRIYRALVRAGVSGMPVGRLQERLKIPASTLSHHVKGLVSVGLISQVREGTTLVCHAEYDTMRGLVDFLVAECCAEESQCREARTAA